MLGYPMEKSFAEQSMHLIPLQMVTDAKDNFDKCNSDTPTYGSQKSLAFTVAWIRSMLRRDSTEMKWTATDNMFVDGGTKLMKLDHMARILQSNEWCVTFSPSFVKQQTVKKSTKPASVDSLVLGQAVDMKDPMFGHLLGLSDVVGWHNKGAYKVHVAKNAKSFRTPEPRFAAEQYPLRSTFGKFVDSKGHAEWRQLEYEKAYVGLPNRHAAIGSVAANLITIFVPLVLSQEENRSAEES